MESISKRQVVASLVKSVKLVRSRQRHCLAGPWEVNRAENNLRRFFAQRHNLAFINGCFQMDPAKGFARLAA